MSCVCKRSYHDIARVLFDTDPRILAMANGLVEMDKNRTVAGILERAWDHGSAPVTGTKTLEQEVKDECYSRAGAILMIPTRYPVVPPPVAEKR